MMRSAFRHASDGCLGMPTRAGRGVWLLIGVCIRRLPLVETRFGWEGAGVSEPIHLSEVGAHVFTIRLMKARVRTFSSFHVTGVPRA